MRGNMFRIVAVIVFGFALVAPQASAQIAIGDGAEGDSFLYFYESGSPTGEFLLWDDSAHMFLLSDDLVADGMVATNSGNMRINVDGPDGNSALYFWEGGSSIGRSLFWDNTQNRFEFNDTVMFSNNIVVGTTADVAYNLFGTSSTPDSGAITSDNDILAYELELDGPLYLSRNLYMEGDSTSPADADQNIYFSNAGTRNAERFFWDDSDDRFRITDGLLVEHNIVVGTTITGLAFNAFNNYTPDSGDITNDADILADDLELDGYLYLSRTMYMEGDSTSPADGDQTIYFADGLSRAGEYIRWDDSVDGFAFSNDIFPAYVSSNYDLIMQVERDGGVGGWFRVFNLNFTNELMRIQSGEGPSTLFDGAVTANGLDYAEAFHIDDQTLEAGDVVVLSLDKPGYIKRSISAGEQHLMGVISDISGFVTGRSFSAEEAADPGLTKARAVALAEGDQETGRRITLELMKKVDQQYRNVALAGRVPVKVDGSHGAIKAGDYLTSSPTPGHAMALNGSGHAIGIALEPWSGGKGMVLTFIQPRWYGGAVVRDGGAISERNIAGDESDAAAGEVTATGTTVVRQAGFQLAVGVGIDALRVIGESLAGFQPVIEAVEAGDVLVADRTYQGWMKRSEMGADPAVVGIVTGTDGLVLGDSLDRFAELDEQLFAELAIARASADDGVLQQVEARLRQQFDETFAPVAMSGIVRCKVDASYAAIDVGDLLSTSPTPGHAMRSEAATPGTIVGKALESMDDGTGTIRVLVMLR